MTGEQRGVNSSPNHSDSEMGRIPLIDDHEHCDLYETSGFVAKALLAYRSIRINPSSSNAPDPKGS